MKRFTETLKWQDPWFRRLSAPAKLLWIYAVDHCDLIGIIELDFDFISSDCCIKVTAEHAKELGERLQQVDEGKYFIPRFIPFQYGKLSESCRPHDKVIEAVRNHSLISTPKGYLFPSDRVSDRVSNTLPSRAKEKKEDKDKEEEEDKKKTGTTRARGTFEEVQEFCREKGLFPRDAEYVFNTWEGNGWKVSGVAIKDWRKTVIAWKAQGYLPSQKNPSASDSWPTEAVQWSDDEPDFLGRMLAKRAQLEAEELALNTPPEID